MTEADNAPPDSNAPRSEQSQIGSVTKNYHGMWEGDEDAYRRIMEYFWFKLVDKTKGVIKPPIRHLLDPESPVLSALETFKEGVRVGKDHDLGHRADILKRLVGIAINKARHRVEKLRTKKAGGPGRPAELTHTEAGRRAPKVIGQLVGGDSVLGPALDVGGNLRLPNRPPQFGPESVARFKDLCRRLIELLSENANLRRIGQAWFELGGPAGDVTAADIKKALHLPESIRRVQDKMKTIRQIWAREIRRMEQESERAV